MNIITDCEQGSPEWFDLRLGSIGGSGIKKATSKGRGKAESKTRTGYLYQKSDEILTGRFIEQYENADMILGTLSETLSRNAYIWRHEVDVEQVAMIKPKVVLNEDAHKHVSPDGLVGDDGMIEIKNTNGPNFIQHIVKDKVPPEHLKQINWGLHIAKREWCDFIHGCWIYEGKEIIPRYEEIPIWTKRVYRDEKLIKELDEGADKFINEMFMIIEKIRKLR